MKNLSVIKSVYKTLALCSLVLVLSFTLYLPSAGKVTTKVTAPTTSKKHKTEKLKIKTDTHTEMAKIAGKLTFMAYDKKTGAAKETFFIDNGSDTNLSGLELEISYFNSAGKLIHKRTVEISQPLPAKETRKVDIVSWDTQKSYHYVNSISSSKGSTPYTVRFKVLSCYTL